jgi:hypothetical protein
MFYMVFVMSSILEFRFPDPVIALVPLCSSLVRCSRQGMDTVRSIGFSEIGSLCICFPPSNGST